MKREARIGTGSPEAKPREAVPVPGSHRRRRGIPALVCTVCFLVGAVEVCADGYQFPGIGARQLARGGAVTSDVSDWTAIYWNPAGLTGVRTRGQVGLHLLYSENEVKDGDSVPNSFVALDATTPPAYGKDTSALDASFGSIGAVFSPGTKNALAVGVYIPLLNGVELDDTEQGLGSTVSVDTETSLYLMYPTLAYATKLGECCSLGVGLSAVTARLELDHREVYVNPLVPMNLVMENSLDGDGTGIEATLGLQCRPNDTIALGFVYRTGTTVDITGDARRNVPDLGPPPSQEVTTSGFDCEFVTPPILAAGFSVSGPRGMVMSVDLQRTFWEDFENGIDFDNPAIADIPDTAHWRHADRLRAGIEWEVRSGLRCALGAFSYEWAVDRSDFLSVVDANQFMWTAGISKTFGSSALDVSFIQGGGIRQENGVDYGIGGWQINLGLSYRF